MFKSARLKLTAWYLAIIMLISVLFSLVIYQGATLELRRMERIQHFRQESSESFRRFSMPAFVLAPEVVEETKQRIRLALVTINLMILAASGAVGYFLAGRTLKPIQEMVDEQNRFITDASHELRTPLTSLRSEIEVNLRDNKLTLVDAQELLRSNLEEVINLQSLSDNLIQLTAYQKRNGTLPFEKLSLDEITAIACRKITPLALPKHVVIKNEVKQYFTNGDKQSLIELFIILLDNAVKYSHENKRIILASKKTDHHLFVSVKDEGVGISKSDLPYVFNRFYRADKSRSKEMATGYGLGLSIAKKIVELHHGSIEVASSLGKGTTFTVKLPLKYG